MRSRTLYVLALAALAALALTGCIPESGPITPSTPDSYCQSLTHAQCTTELTNKVEIALDVYDDTTTPSPEQETAYEQMNDYSAVWADECRHNLDLVVTDSTCASAARDLTRVIQVIDPSLVPEFRQ